MLATHATATTGEAWGGEAGGGEAGGAGAGMLGAAGFGAALGLATGGGTIASRSKICMGAAGAGSGAATSGDTVRSTATTGAQLEPHCAHFTARPGASRSSGTS